MGNPLHFVLSGANAHDMSQADALLARVTELAQELQLMIDHLIADKGYDAEPFRDALRALDIEPVIPYRSRSKHNSDAPPKPQPDRHLYKERHLVECFINRIKHYRRIFTRYDKLASRFLGFLSFVAALVCLR